MRLPYNFSALPTHLLQVLNFILTRAVNLFWSVNTPAWSTLHTYVYYETEVFEVSFNSLLAIQFQTEFAICRLKTTFMIFGFIYSLLGCDNM